MTATLISVRPAGRPNYGLRRAVAALLLLVVLATAVVAVDAVSASLGGVPASAAEDSPAGTAPSVHVARSGDTMWSIASAHRGGTDHGRYLDALLRLNGGSHVEVGQAVRLP